MNKDSIVNTVNDFDPAKFSKEVVDENEPSPSMTLIARLRPREVVQ